MKLRLYIPILASMIALSCGSSGPTSGNSNTEVVVTYNGQEELRKNSRYISENHLRSLLDQGNDTIVIFGADWCAPCRLTRQVIKEAKLNVKVYHLDLDEPWVAQLAGIMGIKTIPVMFHTGKAKETIAIRVGPEGIISYLVRLF